MNAIDQPAVAAEQGKFFAGIAEAAGPTADDMSDVGILGAYGHRVGRYDEVRAGRKDRGGENEVDAPGELPAGQIDGRRAAVQEFDILFAEIFNTRAVYGVVHNLADHYVLGGIVSRHGRAVGRLDGESDVGRHGVVGDPHRVVGRHVGPHPERETWLAREPCSGVELEIARRGGRIEAIRLEP